MKILIATGNQDKYKRIKSWIGESKFEVISFLDIPEEFVENSKLSSEEERQFTSMDYRALAKVKKAISGLKNYPEELIILSTDEVAHFPWMDVEIIDVRQPQEIKFNSEVVIPKAEQRLTGANFANTYAAAAGKVAKKELMLEEIKLFGETTLPDYKFMPIHWKFSMAVGNNKTQKAEIISKWGWTQYIKDTKLPEDTPDTGYMIGLISSNNPLKKTNDLEFKKDDVPIKALEDFFAEL